MSEEQSFFKEEKKHVNAKVEGVLREAGDLPMYDMLRYFMGFQNGMQKPSEGTHGKRTRSSLLLMVAKMFGGATTAPELSAAIELFHNFTLIHDDIVDHDEMRRGQETVWKLWGVDHAINSGDAQLLLTNRCLLNVATSDPVHGVRAARIMNDYFLEVCEGQYLDFELTKQKLGDPLVTQDAYLEMIRKKTAVLVGVATAAGGAAAGCSDEVVKKLFTYGERLGLAYQIMDDFVSVWSESEATGKRVLGDIYEKKKTYPVLFTREQVQGKRLVELYEKKEEFTETEVREVVTLFEQAGAREATQRFAQAYVAQACEAVQTLPLNEEDKKKLTTLVERVVQVAGKLEMRKV